ncbi:nitric oxide reductase, partial [bacterium]
MTPSLLDRLLTRKGLYAAFWVVSIIMVTTLIVFTANLQKEVPPLPQKVVSAAGETLYTYDDIVGGKGMFQQFDLMDYGSLLGMGAYLGPDFSTEFFHRRAEFLYGHYGREEFNIGRDQLTAEQEGWVKELVKKDFYSGEGLNEGTVTYTDASAAAYKANKAWLVDFLVNGNREMAWVGGVINTGEAELISAFVDWSQMVAGTKRTGTDRTWSNDWPPEPLVDQDVSWNSHKYTLWELLALWVGTILVLFIAYEKLLNRKDEELEEALVITKLFPSQQKLIKYVPTVGLFFLLQMIIGGYLAHIYTDPANNFILDQSIIPFNVMRALHVNLAILWVTIGWLVGGMLIAPLVGNEDLKFPWLVDVLWGALLVVGGGGLVGIYMGATGNIREVWFWLGNEGRELLNLGRVWDIGLVLGLVMWFLMVFSVIRKAKENSVLVGTIIW